MISPVTTIQVVAFLDLLAAGLIVPQVPFQANSLGGNLVVVGFIGSVYSGLQLLSGPVTGTLSDLKGRSQTLFVSICVSGLAYVLLGVADSIILFLVLRSFLGITKHTQLLAKTLVPDYAKDQNEMSSVYGRLYSIKQAGMTIGPVISGHIMESFPDNGFTIIAFIVGAIFAINSGLVRSLPNVDAKEDKKKLNEEGKKKLNEEDKKTLNEEHKKTLNDEDKETLNEEDKKLNDQTPIALAIVNVVKTSCNQSVDQFYKINWTKYRHIFSFKLLMSICVGVFLNNYALFLKIKHGVSAVTTGYIISLLSASSSITSFYVSRINDFYEKDKDYSERNLHVFTLLTLSLLGVTFAPDVSVYVAFIIPLGVASTLGNLITQEFILCKTDDDQRGTVLGVAGNVRAVTGTIAPLVSGILGQYFGVLQVAYVSIILAAAGMIKSYVMRIKTIDIKQK